VTHGPLTATLLLDAFMSSHAEATVTGYRFAAKSPLFANEQIHLVGRQTEGGVHELQAIAPDGKVAIAATVTTEGQVMHQASIRCSAPPSSRALPSRQPLWRISAPTSSRTRECPV